MNESRLEYIHEQGVSVLRTKIENNIYSDVAGSVEISPPNAHVTLQAENIEALEENEITEIMPPLQVFGPFHVNSNDEFPEANERVDSLRDSGWDAGRVPGANPKEKYVKIISRFPPGYVPARGGIFQLKHLPDQSFIGPKGQKITVKGDALELAIKMGKWK